VPFPAPFDDLETLRQLADTARLAFGTLSLDACARLQRAGLLSEERGWWRITALGQQALADHARLPSTRKLDP
jgi:hypothetical protein